MDDFYEQFAKKTSIPDSNCLVLAFSRDETNNGNVKLCKFPLALSMSVICHLHLWMLSMDEVSPSMDDIHG